MLTSARARALIGGRWAVSLQGWLIALVAATVAALATRSSQAADSSSAGRLGLMLLAMASAAVMLLVAHLTLFRHRAEHPVPLWWVMALGAGAWLTTLPFRLLAGYATFGAAPGNGATVSGTIALVLLLSIQGAVGWPIIALGLALHDDYRRVRGALIDQAVRQEAARLRDIGAIAALRVAAMEDIARDIAPSVEDAALAAAAATPDSETTDLSAVADLLSETASEVVRPRSHELWRSAGAALPRVRPRRVLSSALRRNPLPTAAALATFAVLFLTGALARTGWSFLPAAAACVLGAAVIYAIGRRIVERHATYSALIGATTILVATVSVVVMPLLLWDSGATRTAALLGAGFVVSALASSVAITALRSGEEAIDELTDIVSRRAVEQAALRREVAALNRELASHLHGTVQARLVAAAYAMREADRTGDRAASRQAAEAAQQALADAMAAPVPLLFTDTPGDLQAEVTAQWGDVLAITWNAEASPLTPDEAHTTAEVLRHALKNAVGHGGASAADIAVDRDDEHVRITVIDDGAGPLGGACGLGSTYLDEVASAWSLEPGPSGGSILRAWLASPHTDPSIG